MIDEAHDKSALERFEHAAIEGFESPALHDLGTFALHAPGILRDPRMHVLVGRLEGRIVSVGMAFVAAGVVGVYGVATLPAFRGRGYATALTARAVECAPALPAVLQPSPKAASLYRRMGFDAIGAFARWSR